MPTRLEQQIDHIVARASNQIADAVRASIADEVQRLLKGRNTPPAIASASGQQSPQTASRAPVRAAKAAVSSPRAAVKPAIKTAASGRVWPKCTAAGCTKNLFAPSGPARLCYAHYQEAGGKHYSRK